MKEKKELKNGFTLVELLLIICILSIIIGIVIVFSISIINRAKEKTYQITINEIESNANNYLIENNQNVFFLTDYQSEYEYQCITVEDLVHYGYLDNNITNSNISNDDYVKLEDYIYVEKDLKTKTITKMVYLRDNSMYYDVCEESKIVTGDIVVLSEPSLDTWSKNKNITITYKLKNLTDYRTLNDYSYNHLYSGEYLYDETMDTFSNNTKVKKINVTSSGLLDTNVINIKTNEIIASKNVVIDKIDNKGPIVTLGDYSGDKNVANSVTIPINLIDEGIGVDYSSFTKEDVIVIAGEKKLTDIILEEVNDGEYNLTINSENMTDEIVLKFEKDTIFDKLGNGNNEIIINTDIAFKLFRLKIIGELDGNLSDDLIDSYTKLHYGKYDVEVNGEKVARNVTSFDRYIPVNSTYTIKITKEYFWKVNSPTVITKQMPDSDVIETLSFSVAAYKAVEVHGKGNVNKISWRNNASDIMYLRVGQGATIGYTCPSGYRNHCTVGVGLKDYYYRQIDTTAQGYDNTNAYEENIFTWTSDYMKCGSTSSISLKALGPGYTVRTATCFRYNRNVNNIDRYDRRLIIAVAP